MTRRQDNLRGIAFMVLSQLALLFNDTFVKLVSAELPLGETIFGRGLIVTALLLVAATLRGEHRQAARLLHPTVGGRIAGELGGTLFYLIGLFQVPIANAIILFQATPFVAAVGAAVVLRERVAWQRWLAIAVGFVGVLIVVRPGLAGFDPFGLFLLGSTVFVAVRDVLTRSMPADVPSLLTAAVTAFAVTLLGLALGLGEAWVWPSPTALACLAAAAVLILFGYYWIILAVRIGEMSVTAPFRYVTVPVAIATGFLVWGDRPDWGVALGSLVIVVTGIAMVRFEARRERS